MEQSTSCDSASNMDDLFRATFRSKVSDLDGSKVLQGKFCMLPGMLPLGFLAQLLLWHHVKSTSADKVALRFVY